MAKGLRAAAASVMGSTATNRHRERHPIDAVAITHALKLRSNAHALAFTDRSGARPDRRRGPAGRRRGRRPRPAGSSWQIRSARGFLVEGDLGADDLRRAAVAVLADSVAESFAIRPCGDGAAGSIAEDGSELVHVLPQARRHRPGGRERPGGPPRPRLRGRRRPDGPDLPGRRAGRARCRRLIRRVLANDAVEQVVVGPLDGRPPRPGAPLPLPPRRGPDPRHGRRRPDADEPRGPALALASTRCGRSRTTSAASAATRPTASWRRSPRPGASTARTRPSAAGSSSTGEVIDNLLKQTIFKATKDLEAAASTGSSSVFEDNAGVVRFDDEYDVCFKVETHNHPSAIDPYGGANTGHRRRDPRPAGHRPGRQADLQHRRLLRRPARHCRSTPCPPACCTRGGS